MSLLEEFIFALSKTERQKLRPLQFRGVKRRIFLKILKCRSRTGIDAEGIVRASKITRLRYNQLLSEMLAACYRDVAPRGGIDLLRFLGNKQLFRHHYYEMRKQETFALSSGNPTTIEMYYLKVLLVSEFYIIPPGNAKVLAEGRGYVAKYVEAKRPKHPNDRLFVRIEVIDEQIEAYIKSAFDSKKVNHHLAQLKEVLELARGTNPFLEFVLIFKLLRHYLRLVLDFEQAEYYYHLGMQLIAAHPKLLGEIEDYFELQYKFELENRTGNITNVSYYRKYFDEKKLWRNGFPLRYLYHFYPMLLRTGDLRTAKSYIQKYFPYNPDLLSYGIAIYYWRLLMLFHLYSGNLVEAERCMRKALESNIRKGRNIRMEILIRQFEVFFIAMKGNPLLAEEAAKRHIRYMIRNGFKNTEFLRAVIELIKCIDTDRSQAVGIYNNYIAVLPEAHHMRLIIERIYAKYFGVPIRIPSS